MLFNCFNFSTKLYFSTKKLQFSWMKVQKRKAFFKLTRFKGYEEEDELLDNANTVLGRLHRAKFCSC